LFCVLPQLKLIIINKITHLLLYNFEFKKYKKEQ
jgi:hypothetical protein